MDMVKACRNNPSLGHLVGDIRALLTRHRQTQAQAPMSTCTRSIRGPSMARIRN
jgi:hypothetical protein